MSVHIHLFSILLYTVVAYAPSVVVWLVPLCCVCCCKLRPSAFAVVVCSFALLWCLFVCRSVDGSFCSCGLNYPRQRSATLEWKQLWWLCSRVVVVVVVVVWWKLCSSLRVEEGRSRPGGCLHGSGWWWPPGRAQAGHNQHSTTKTNQLS